MCCKWPNAKKYSSHLVTLLAACCNLGRHRIPNGKNRKNSEAFPLPHHSLMMRFECQHLDRNGSLKKTSILVGITYNLFSFSQVKILHFAPSSCSAREVSVTRCLGFFFNLWPFAQQHNFLAKLGSKFWQILNKA